MTEIVRRIEAAPSAVSMDLSPFKKPKSGREDGL